MCSIVDNVFKDAARHRLDTVDHLHLVFYFVGYIASFYKR